MSFFIHFLSTNTASLSPFKYCKMGICASKDDSSSLTNVNAVNTKQISLQITPQSPPIVNASSLPFETKGVHISVFKDFVKKHNGNQYLCENNYWDKSKGSVMKTFEEMTTTDVCEVLLKPIVVADKSSYVDYLVKYKDPSVVSKAQVFISHAMKTVYCNIAALWVNGHKSMLIAYNFTT